MTLTEKRQLLCSQVSLSRLYHSEENVRVDELACVGYVSEKKIFVWTSCPLRATGEARKRPCGQVSLHGLFQ